jgi:hypothetical protein
MPPETPATLGPFRLRVDPARAAAYARETGGNESRAPLCYPALWLTEPALFAPVRDLCEALDVVPVHEAQSFSYETPLVVGASYDVRAALRREETPPRLVIDATITTPEGRAVATSETMLRLVPRAGFGAAS